MTNDEQLVNDSASPGGPGGDLMAAGKVHNYRSERGARAYHDDHQKKLHRRWSDRRERRILGSFLGRVGPLDSMLDVPCGFGRLLDVFREHAAAVTEADFSPSMLELNEQLHGDGAKAYLHCSALDIPAADRAFGATASIRLSHHLERHEDRLQHIRELCRVSDRAVILTYFSSTSLKNRLRRLRAKWNGKRPKNTLSGAEVAAEFQRCGFRVSAMQALSILGSGHIYVLAERAR